MKLENLTFHGGTHVKEHKELSSGSEIVVMPAPARVRILTQQHIGAPARVLVKKGDTVTVGQVIAEANGMISAAVHSSVSGVVSGIEDYLGANGKKVQAVVIENDGQDTLGYEAVDRSGQELSAEQIVQYIREAGIIGMGGAGFPTHVKLVPPADTPVDTIILNGSECEPYLTGDDLLMRTYPEKVVTGLKLAMKAAGATNGFIAVEDNKPKAIEALCAAVGENPNITVAVMKTKYPQGDEGRVIYSVTGKKLRKGALPATLGIIVSNVATAAAITDAVIYGKPLYERLVTVTGHAVNEPKNLLVRVGSAIKDVISFAGGYAEEPGKIIFGGPMMGVAQYSDEAPVEKRNNGILVLTQEEALPPVISPCIRCGKCVDVCPAGLEPLYIATASKAENWDIVEQRNAQLCIECGSCSYVCPAKRPLMEYIRLGKKELAAVQRARAQKEAK